MPPVVYCVKKKEKCWVHAEHMLLLLRRGQRLGGFFLLLLPRSASTEQQDRDARQVTCNGQNDDGRGVQ